MINIIHCIENKSNHTFEDDAIFYIESFKKVNPELFEQVSINFLQPTPNDVSTDTISYFNDNNINFTRIPTLSSKQINKDHNYTNKCVSCAYFSETLTSEYMLWLDLDIIFLQKFPQEFFKETDKITLTIYPINNEFSKKDKLFRIEKYYDELFKHHVEKKYRISKITSYVNGWFIYGPRTHKFWAEWKELTYKLIDIVHTHYPEMISDHFEGTCEEIATSILYAIDPSAYQDVRDFFGTNTLSFREGGIDNEETLRCKENTLLYHYNDVKGLFTNDLIKFDYKKTVAQLILSNLDVTYLMSIKEITAKDLTNLYK